MSGTVDWINPCSDWITSSASIIRYGDTDSILVHLNKKIGSGFDSSSCYNEVDGSYNHLDTKTGMIIFDLDDPLRSEPEDSSSYHDEVD